MEAPSWTKDIPSEYVCNFFYVFFVIYAVILAITVVGTLGMFLSIKLPKSLLLVNGLTAFIALAIATTQFLFFYLICDRALKPGSPVKKAIDEAFTGKH